MTMSSQAPGLLPSIQIAVPPSVTKSMCSISMRVESMMLKIGWSSVASRGNTRVRAPQPRMVTLTRPWITVLVVCRPGSRQISPPAAGRCRSASSMELKSPKLDLPSPTT